MGNNEAAVQPTRHAPKVELRKFKAYEKLSEETLCFHGDVYVDGVYAGRVKNDGKGGSTYVDWTYSESAERARAYIVALPPVRFTSEEMDFEVSSDEDNFFSRMADAMLQKEHDKKLKAKRAKFAQRARRDGLLPYEVELDDGTSVFCGLRRSDDVQREAAGVAERYGQHVVSVKEMSPISIARMGGAF